MVILNTLHCGLHGKAKHKIDTYVLLEIIIRIIVPNPIITLINNIHNTFITRSQDTANFI